METLLSDVFKLPTFITVSSRTDDVLLSMDETFQATADKFTCDTFQYDLDKLSMLADQQIRDKFNVLML